MPIKYILMYNITDMYDGMKQYKEQTSGETTLENCITYTNRHVHHTKQNYDYANGWNQFSVNCGRHWSIGSQSYHWLKEQQHPELLLIDIEM